MAYMQTIDHLVETVRKACDRGCNCSLLIGAGCSVTAGIPTAGGFVERIEKDFPKKFALADEKTYAGCMAELTPGERRSLIAEYVDAARINWAHIAIACLLRNGFVDRVLTTNFDPLVVRACALLNEFPAVYDFAASSLYKGAYVPEKAVFHLHGQRTGFVLINTEEDYERHSGLLAPVFEDAGRGRVWVVVGYSGESDPVFDHLAKTRVFDEGLYWIGYEERDAPQHVREKLLASDKSAYYVQGFDADGFFVTLARNLGVFPPDLLDKPFTHLDACLQTITPEFTELGQDTPTDVCRGTRDLIARAIQRFEEEVIEETVEAKREIAEARSVSELQRLMMAGNYDAVISEYAKAPQEASEDVKDLAARAHLLRGNGLLEGARATQEGRADRLFAEAITSYRAVLEIRPDNHSALGNWGFALYTQGMRNAGAEAGRLFEQACEKYEAALAIKPDFHEALNWWGNALLVQARASEGAEADVFFAQACEKYAAVLKIKPDFHLALGNWGLAFIDQAKRTEGPEADRLLAQACAKYGDALAIEPNYYEGLNNWGLALCARAKATEGAEADVFFAQAYEKYAAAVKIKSDEHGPLHNWAGALLRHGAMPHMAERSAEMFARAKEKALEAERIKPGAGAYNAACASALLGEKDECRKWLETALEHGTLPKRAHLEDDRDLDSVRDTDWFKGILEKAPGQVVAGGVLEELREAEEEGRV